MLPMTQCFLFKALAIATAIVIAANESLAAPVTAVSTAMKCAPLAPHGILPASLQDDAAATEPTAAVDALLHAVAAAVNNGNALETAVDMPTMPVAGVPWAEQLFRCVLNEASKAESLAATLPLERIVTYAVTSKSLPLLRHVLDVVESVLDSPTVPEAAAAIEEGVASPLHAALSVRVTM